MDYGVSKELVAVLKDLVFEVRKERVEMEKLNQKLDEVKTDLHDIEEILNFRLN